MKKSEISLPEIFRILMRKKGIILFTIILSLLAAVLYIIFKKPVYESSVLLKKEMFLEGTEQDKVQSILALRSQDELETEMELVQTRNVLNNVIDELSLNILITKIIEQDGTVTIIDLPLIEYQHKYEMGEYSKKLPKINSLSIGLNTKEALFKIVNTQDGKLDIIDDKNNNVFSSKISYSNLSPSEWKINIEWDKNGEIHFESLDYNRTFDNLMESIYTDKKINTNIFAIYTQSQYPYTAKEIANVVTNKFKETRIKLQKDNIKYSFDFIDDQLKDISRNLENAENELSQFKSKEKIVQIDEQSKKLVEFLSSLESEKLKNDLELGLYKNKLKNFTKEMLNEGYVDQTYLTPEQYQSYNSPFSNMLNELTKLELDKIDLLQRRTEQHPDVVLITEQIERVKFELSKYNQNTITAFQIIYNSLKNKQSNLNSLIRKYSSKLEKLPDQEAKLAGLIRQKEAYEKMYKLMLDKREEMKIAEYSKLQDIIVLDSAIEPVKPISPNKKLNLLFAGLFGLLAGIAFAFISNFTDKNINDISEIERDYDFPILSVIPPYTKNIKNLVENSDIIKDKFVTMMEDEYSYREAFRTFETKINTKIKGHPKKVMITSCEESAGKSTVAANLAISAAQSGKKVLLIDCDIKKPSLAELFGLPKFSSGLIDYLMEITDSPNIFKPVNLTKNANLLMNIDIIPTGVFSNISGEILASGRMEKLLSNLTDYDLVILDTPPITRLSDALALGRIVKDTVLVIRMGQTVKESISWAINELQTSDINFLGALVNDCEIKESSYKYKYGYSNS